jgi:hypothetical protein
VTGVTFSILPPILPLNRRDAEWRFVLPYLRARFWLGELCLLFPAGLMRCSSDWSLFMCIHVTWTRQTPFHPFGQYQRAPTEYYVMGAATPAGRDVRPRAQLQVQKATFCFPKLAVGTIAEILPSLFLNIWDGYAPLVSSEGS